MFLCLCHIFVREIEKEGCTAQRDLLVLYRNVPRHCDYDDDDDDDEDEEDVNDHDDEDDDDDDDDDG